ncbi:forkhead box protein B1 [Elysia marginata]|uniref:Forkhead box protein B1 n=1 Tax=Elysia marginata TaxID=1093978 RepID=A0AAV4G2V3_9GAST|nr:forkhead box protein B1 [Elysia marginata]
MMASIVKTVLPSFSIFRKIKRPLTPQVESSFHTPSCRKDEINYEPEPPVVTNNEPSRTLSPCDGNSEHSVEGCFDGHTQISGLQVDVLKISRDITTSFDGLTCSTNTRIAADQHQLDNMTTQCTNFTEVYPSVYTDVLACDEHVQAVKAYVSTGNTQPDLKNPEVLAVMNENQSAWATMTRCQDMPDYNLHHSAQSAFPLSIGAAECFSRSTPSLNNPLLWPEAQAMSSHVYSSFPTVAAPDSLVETFDNQTDFSNSLYCPIGEAFTADDVGQSMISSSIPYHPTCLSDDLLDKPNTGEFHGLTSYMTANNLGYGHEGTFVNVSEQPSRDESQYIYTHPTGGYNSSSLSAEQIDLINETDRPGTTGTGFYDKSNDMEQYNATKRVEKESEENEIEEDLDNGDECATDEDQRGKDRQGSSKVESYITLISKAILDSPERKLPISDIYAHIRKHNPGISTSQKSWQNTVRHNLSLNECFVKQVRKGKGRGHYWMVHPACVDDFLKGNYRRRHARRRAKKCPLMARETNFMDGNISEHSSGSFLQLENVPDTQPLPADTALWDATTQLIKRGTSMEIQPALAVSNPLAEQGCLMFDQVDNLGQALGNVSASWFVGGETPSSTDWLEFPISCSL